jgi:excisionase family DNA binding protein
MKLEELLRMQVTVKDKSSNDMKVSPEFRISVRKIDFNPDGVHFTIHPEGIKTPSLDFVVHDNNITLLDKNQMCHIPDPEADIEYISPQEAAKIIERSYETVMRRIKKGKLKAFKIGKIHLLDKAVVIKHKENTKK